MFNIAYSLFLKYKMSKQKIKPINEQELLSTKFSDSAKMEIGDCYKTLEKFRPYRSPKMKIVRKQNRNIDLSIIIPVYNAEKTIGKCLNSILESKLRVTYEVICINDGSTDNSVDVINTFEKFNQLILVDQPNKGASAARNTGLELARGRYIFFLDSDDFVRKNYFNGFVEDCIGNNRCISVSSVGRYVSDLHMTLYPIGDIGINKSLRAINKKYDYCPGTPWGKMYHYSLWQNVCFFDGFAFEDTNIFLTVWQLANEIFYYKKPIYCFRTSDNSLFKRQKNNYCCIDSLWVVNECINLNKRLNVKMNNQEFYKLLLWHTGPLLIGRLASIAEKNVLESAFNVVADMLENDFPELRKEKFEDNIGYEMIKEGFFSRNIEMWEYGCRRI